MKIEELQIRDQAKKAVDFFNHGGNKKGGFKLSHKTSSFGIALRYIFALRDLSYCHAAEKLKTSPQNINYMLNRMSKENYNDIFVDKLCNIFSIDSGYFSDLVKEIDNVLEGK